MHALAKSIQTQRTTLPSTEKFHDPHALAEVVSVNSLGRALFVITLSKPKDRVRVGFHASHIAPLKTGDTVMIYRSQHGAVLTQHLLNNHCDPAANLRCRHGYIYAERLSQLRFCQGGTYLTLNNKGDIFFGNAVSQCHFSHKGNIKMENSMSQIHWGIHGELNLTGKQIHQSSEQSLSLQSALITLN